MILANFEAAPPETFKDQDFSGSEPTLATLSCASSDFMSSSTYTDRTPKVMSPPPATALLRSWPATGTRSPPQQKPRAKAWPRLHHGSVAFWILNPLRQRAPSPPTNTPRHCGGKRHLNIASQHVFSSKYYQNGLRVHLVQ